MIVVLVIINISLYLYSPESNKESEANVTYFGEVLNNDATQKVYYEYIAVLMV